MAARTHITDSGDTERLVSRWFAVDSGGTSRAAKRVFVVDSGGTSRLIFSGVTISVPVFSLYASALSTSNATCSFRVDTDGNVYATDDTFFDESVGTWIDAPAYAADYEVRATRTSGTETFFTSGANNTWLAMSSDRTWTLVNTVDAADLNNIVFTLEFRRTSDLVVMDSDTCEMTSEVTE